MSESAAREKRPHEFSAEGRREEAASGVAMADGSFPIRNREDLHNAIRDIGRAKDPEAARRHIIQRARILGAESDLPADWGHHTGEKKSMPESSTNNPEATETKPADTDNRDTEPKEEVVPHSAKALADYHDGLKDLHEVFQQHHGALHEEMQKHYKAMEHPEIKPLFEKWLGEHQKHMQAHSDFVGEMTKDMAGAFEEHHPDYGKLDNEDKPDEPTKNKPTEESRERRTEREEEETGPGKSTTAAASTPPVLTKAAAVVNNDGINELEGQLILSMLERIDKKAAQQEQRLEREMVGAK